MEIERKFLIDKFPDNLPLVDEAVVYQGYISVNPVVRIRSVMSNSGTRYELCFKGKGTIARQEIQIELDEKTFNELENLLNSPMVRKDFKVYELPGGHRLECSLVDEGEPTEFMFAEIEFDTLEQALEYQPPEFLNREVTEDRYYGMASYWIRKSNNKV
ncbi:MAG: CYTH domain-containing protein [Oscillospiraceae bacterium]|nr:CYTH domain-containing protein [Oscillospiraceae bacterium]